MRMNLTAAYVTCRWDCRLEWFLDSLALQLNGDPIEVIIVDFFADEPGRRKEHLLKLTKHPNIHFTITEPKPNVWSGPHRLTKDNWFSAANSRNTALCLCKTSHIAYVDDLSVLMPGWLQAAKDAIEGNYVACGAYKKVRELTVIDGVPTHYIETDSGTDDRLRRVTEDVSPCTGGWLYGCSVVAPVETLLSVDGWPEMICDGQGAEDYTLGIVLANCDVHLKYDRRLLTLESEELHQYTTVSDTVKVSSSFRREDFGVSPDDKSHRALNIARQSRTFENGYTGGMRGERERVLSGQPFTIKGTPEHEWYTGARLADL